MQKVKRTYSRRSVSVNLVKDNSTPQGGNPFVIEEGVTLTGNRGSNISVVAQQLLEQVKKLPVDKNVSVLIPKSVAESVNQVVNLVLKVRRLLADDRHVSKNFAITMRTFKDGNGNLVSSRIWRIS